jgi:hypothetical protein
MSYTPVQQYTEGDVDATITGTAIVWEDTGDVLRPVSAAKPLPMEQIAGPGFNGAAFSAIALGAYTTSQNSGVLTNSKNTGLLVFIKITGVGTGSLHPAIQYVDTITGDAYQVNLGEPVLTAVGNYGILFGAAASAPSLAQGSGIKQVVPLPVPRDYRIVITHANTSASTWTYRVNAALFGT